MLWQRIASALLALPLVLWAVYQGGWLFVFLLAVIACSAWRELMQMQAAATGIVGPLGCLLLTGILYGAWVYPARLWLAFTLSIFLLLASLLWRYPEQNWDFTAHAITSFVYLGLPLVHLVWLGNLPTGRKGVFLLLVCTWCYDSFAFFMGSRFGRRRPWAHISPNKSLEGVAGGLVGSVLAALGVFLAFLPTYVGGINLYIYAVFFGLGAGFLAQMGDLFESVLKRSHQIKDSGRFLPGHGGVLDRIDSILFVIPFTYYFLTGMVL